MRSFRLCGTALLCLATVALHAQGIRWRTDYKSALAEAKRTKKVLVVDFYAKWCQPCKKLDKVTYVDKGVQKFLKGVIPVRLDVEIGNNQSIADGHHVLALPTVAVIDGNGVLRGSFIGFKDPKAFVAKLKPFMNKTR